MANARDDHEQLGEPRLLRRPRAEIGGDRGDDVLLVNFQSARQDVRGGRAALAGDG